MSAEPGHDSTFRNKDAIRTLDHQGQLSAPAVDRPTLLCRSVVDVASSDKTLLVVHSQLAQLHLIVNERLERIWDFEKDIASICWNDTEAKGKDQRNSTELLVGTVDGRVWNVALLNPAEAPIPPKTSIDSELRTVIKIEDDEEKDLEEIELWNDEDGLLDGFDQLQDVSEPPLKRQRIGLSSSQISPEFDKQQESRVETIKISEYNNLVGSEPGIERIVKSWNRLMVFRHDQNPIVWSSPSQFQPGHAVSKTLVTLDRRLGVVTSASSEQETGLFVGTRDGLLWRFMASQQDDRSFKAVATCCELLDEPILALQVLHHKDDPGSLSENVVAIGASGNLASLDIPASQRDPLLTKSIRRKNVVTPIHSAAIAGNYFYIVTTHGEVHRVSSRLFKSSNVDIDLVQLPRVCALTPILRSNTPEGFYGLQQNGAVVHMTMDLKMNKRDRDVIESRDNIDDLLRDLERLNEQARDLESQCQAQNTRISSYNQVAHILQTAVLASNSSPGQGGPLVDLSVTAIVRHITKGFSGQRRHVVQIRISSHIDLDWSHGWSVVLRMVESRNACPHGTVVGTPLQHEVFADLRNLSPHSAWIQELEIDMSKTRLPLIFHVGVQYNEASSSGSSQYTSYFFIESFGLDALHFADPYRDPANGNPGHPRLAGKDIILRDQQSRHRRPQGDMTKGGGSYCPACIECTINDAHGPLVFSFDAADIQLDQCLSAILADCLPGDRVRAMIQTAERAAVTLPDICLPNISIADPNTNTDTHSAVWINLEEQDRHGTVIKASLQVKGADPWRVTLVHQALRKRIAALFD